MKEQLQTSVEYLAHLCLEEAVTHHSYTDKDLEHATIIFTHFLFDVVYSVHKDKCEMAKTTGEAIRTLILKTTGKDMKVIAKQ